MKKKPVTDPRHRYALSRVRIASLSWSLCVRPCVSVCARARVWAGARRTLTRGVMNAA